MIQLNWSASVLTLTREVVKGVDPFYLSSVKSPDPCNMSYFELNTYKNQKCLKEYLKLYNLNARHSNVYAINGSAREEKCGRRFSQRSVCRVYLLFLGSYVSLMFNCFVLSLSVAVSLCASTSASVSCGISVACKLVMVALRHNNLSFLTSFVLVFFVSFFFCCCYFVLNI